MVRPSWRALLPAALFVVAGTAQPQPAALGRADPLNPKAEVPALQHASALADYRRLADDKPVAWKEANDTVHRIGGWRAYAREASQSASAPTAAPGPGSAR